MRPDPMDGLNIAVKNVVMSLLDKSDGDTSVALDMFSEGSQDKFKQGRSPNQAYSLVANILQELDPLQNEIENFDVGNKLAESSVFTALVNENVRKMNSIIGEDLYEEVEDEFKGDRLQGYKQALIKLESKLPNLKGKERDAALWNIAKLTDILSSGELL